MNKSEFDTELFHRSFKKMPHINFDEVIRKIIVDVENKDTNSDHGPVIFYAEESSELQEVLTRIVRNRISKDDSDLYQEMADVLIVIDIIKEWLQMDEEKLKYAIDVKLNRFMKANDLHYNYERRQIEYGSKEESL